MSQQLKHSLSQTNQSASPIIKWAGGKNSLLSQFEPYFPRTYHRYFEPFLGGAAMFFHLQATRSYLFDLNPHLIEVYQVIRDSVDALINALKQHHNDKDYFYQVRAQKPEQLTSVARA